MTVQCDDKEEEAETQAVDFFCHKRISLAVVMSRGKMRVVFVARQVGGRSSTTNEGRESVWVGTKCDG